MARSRFGGASRLWRKFAATSTDLEADTLQRQAERLGATPIEQALPGHEYVFAGVLASVTLHPSGSAHGFDAELFDGTGRIRLVWLGRSGIPGIAPGRRMSITGRVVRAPGAAMGTVFNPRYTLLPAEA
jgi:hypothetical protein